MADVKSQLKSIVADAVNAILKEINPEAELADAEKLQVVTPPNPEMGDLGIPLFVFAKSLKMAPPQIAKAVAEKIKETNSPANAGTGAAQNSVNNKTNSPNAAPNSADGGANTPIGEFLAVGPYINLKLEKSGAASDILKQISEQGEKYGTFNAEGKAPLEGRKVMVEFSSPNTNKPLHLGHLRNDTLGESVSRILKKAGAEVFKVDLINNRGVHICKSMLAYKLFHEEKGETPESLGIKGDHFVGQCYVEFDKYSKEHPEALQEAEDMLVKWEAGDEEIRALWQKMNDWTLAGVKETYKRTGIEFDKYYLESETYLKGKDEILKGLEKGVFFRADDGSVRFDVTDVVGKGKDEDNHEKVLLRKDGTSVYITQDIGTAISRHADWPFNQMVYVVASEQNYHFKILFHILKKLGFDWADRLYHLSYGLVNIPSGRMKSREGTVVDADDLIDNLHADAMKELVEKGRDKELENADDVAEKVALSALHYYLLQATPAKDMLFNPAESLSFNGNTGPYLQYMGARIASILRKAKENGINPSAENIDLLKAGEEWELIKSLGDFPETVRRAAENLDPSTIAAFLYDLSKLFSKFYQNCSIMNCEDKSLQSARLFLAECTLTVMKNAMDLVLVPYLEKM